MARVGYFLIYKKLFDHEISENPLMVALWVRLLADAHWQDEEKELSHKKKILIKRGQVFTSIEKLAKWLKVSRTTTRCYLSIYQSMQQIDTKTYSKYTIITIRNYDKYQVKLQQSIQQSNQQSDTEYKYIKNIKNNIGFEKIQTPKISRKEFKVPKDLMNELVNYYVQRKGISPQGNEWLPIQQAVKTMLMNGRIPTEIKEFIYWLSTHWATWDIHTVMKRMPEYLAGKLDAEKNKVNQIKNDAILKRYWDLTKKGELSDTEFRLKMTLIAKLEEKYPAWKYEKEWEEIRSLL